MTLPYRLVFEIEPKGGPLLALDNVGITYFLMDIAKQFVTAYNRDGLLITKPQRIWKRYFVTAPWFWLDVLASFPYPWVFQGGSTARLLRVLRFARFLRVLRLLKIAKVKKILRKVEDVTDSTFLATVGMRIIRVMLWLVLLSHWSACMWYLVGKLTK